MPASLEALRAVKDEVIDRALREVEFGTAQGRVSGLDARAHPLRIAAFPLASESARAPRVAGEP